MEPEAIQETHMLSPSSWYASLTSAQQQQYQLPMTYLTQNWAYNVALQFITKGPVFYTFAYMTTYKNISGDKDNDLYYTMFHI